MRTYKTTYTKHYYIEGERICSKIGGGFQWAHTPPTSTPIGFIADDPHTCSMHLRDMVDRNTQCAEYDGEMDISPELAPAYNNGNDYENLQYFYHPDHLGSASFVTDREGAVCQHIQYLPFGELFVSQRNCEFDSRYKFTAKELDNETSYTYFGARYYDSDLSVWLSVDPMSDKYPSLSPYCYSANNPVVLKDPRGMLDDWYRDDETGATFWHEGSESYIERDGVRYRNIGATHSEYSNGIRIDFQQNEVVNVIDVDPNFNLEGGQYIPQQFTTDDGQVVFVDFSYTTMDGNNAYNAISTDAVSLFIMGVNEANNTGANISKIGISATTNGTHSANSAHYVRNGARAFDINKINDLSVRNKSSHDMVNKIQKGMMLNKLNSENYGPNIQISYGKTVNIEGHEGHIHGAVKRNY